MSNISRLLYIGQAVEQNLINKVRDFYENLASFTLKNKQQISNNSQSLVIVVELVYD
jgi:hypothetical protein